MFVLSTFVAGVCVPVEKNHSFQPGEQKELSDGFGGKRFTLVQKLANAFWRVLHMWGRSFALTWTPEWETPREVWTTRLE